MNTVRLIEPGVSYFLEESLKKCNQEKWKYNNIILNGFLLIVFMSILLIIFYNKKIMTKKEKQDKENLKKNYFLNKIKELSELEKQRLNISITNLPKFENDFVQYDKKFI